jgi:glyoxylase-like metal-dependent hydrolase (beta-lactamase superfamily II)
MMLLPAHNASAWTGPTGNNTFLLTGAVPTLIDAGVGAPAHVEDIASALGAAALEAVLITHAHPDHASGVPALVARWPRLNVLQYPAAAEQPIRAGDTDLLPLHTPGHSPDHLCFFDPRSRDVFCGDLVRLGGTIVIPASRGGNVREYFASLRRVRSLAPRRLLPGHGAVIDDPVRAIDEYLRHREERERQILAALTAGAGTPEEITLRVYAKLSAPLLHAAADTVMAHLIHLEEQGKARREGTRWYP